MSAGEKMKKGTQFLKKESEDLNFLSEKKRID